MHKAVTCITLNEELADTKIYFYLLLLLLKFKFLLLTEVHNIFAFQKLLTSRSHISDSKRLNTSLKKQRIMIEMVEVSTTHSHTQRERAS